MAAPVLARVTLAFTVLVLSAAPLLSASPRDEALRLAPPDAALVVVVQNARDHAQNVRASPFAEWFPSSDLGKLLLAAGAVKNFQSATDPLLRELGTNLEELLNEVVGDAVVFAYTPPPAGRPNEEQAVILVRPRKPETLLRLLERVNTAQTKSGEVKGVVRRMHNGEAYFERQRAGGSSEFYCFRGSVFAFSSTEADIKAVIDRDKAAPNGEAPELTAKMTRLGVADALAVVLINPRRLDAELDTKINEAKGDERAILEKFREVWTATDAAAAYITLDRDIEAGLSLRFDAGKLPPWARGWLTGPKTASGLWSAVPDDALFAVAGRFRAVELLELILAILPDEGKKALTAAVSDTLGPVVGKDKLPVVLKALGPDWAIWAEPPRGDGFLPVVVAAVQVSGDGPDAKTAADAIHQGVKFGFQTFRVMYNADHVDQIELKETQDGDVTITSLVNDKGFPPGFRPSFALKGGYLLLASDPDAIKRFRPPSGAPKPGGEVLVARFSGSKTRSYLKTHGPRLSKFLADAGAGNEAELAGILEQVAGVLEPLDKLELVTRSDESSLRIAIRAKLAKPLKK